MNVYRIRDWELHFEKAQSRKCDEMRWVPLPVKHDGLGFRRLMAMPDGLGVYGAWVLIVQVAAKCPTRGTLADESGPLTAEDLSLKTGGNTDAFAHALQVLSSDKVGWLVVTCYQQATNMLAPNMIGQDKTEQDKTEESSPAVAGCPPDLQPWLNWWNDLRDEELVSCGVDPNMPSRAVLKGWARVGKSRQLKAIFGKREQIEQAIRDSTFCREGWFRLEKLFGAKNRDGELIVKKLLEGGYQNRHASRESNLRPVVDPFSTGPK